VRSPRESGSNPVPSAKLQANIYMIRWKKMKSWLKNMFPATFMATDPNERVSVCIRAFLFDCGIWIFGKIWFGMTSTVQAHRKRFLRSLVGIWACAGKSREEYWHFDQNGKGRIDYYWDYGPYTELQSTIEFEWEMADGYELRLRMMSVKAICCEEEDCENEEDFHLHTLPVDDERRQWITIQYDFERFQDDSIFYTVLRVKEIDGTNGMHYLLNNLRLYYVKKHD
jgi:hypothetical protein